MRGIDRTLGMRRIHRRGTARLDPDFRRRSREDGGRCADRRRHGRRHRRRQYGLPGAEDCQAQCRLQPDARARARGERRARDDEGRPNPCHREDARGLGCHRVECARAGGRIEDAGASAVAVHWRTAAQSYSGSSDWEFIARVAESVSIPVFGSGDCIEPNSSSTGWVAAAWRGCSSVAARCAIHGSSDRLPTSLKVVHRERSPTSIARSSCSPTSRCCS